MTSLLTPEQLAERLQVSPRQLTFWRNQGRGPAFGTPETAVADNEMVLRSIRERE